MSTFAAAEMPTWFVCGERGAVIALRLHAERVLALKGISSQLIEIAPDAAAPVSETGVHPGRFCVPFHFVAHAPVGKGVLPALIGKVFFFRHGLLAVVRTTMQN